MTRIINRRDFLKLAAFASISASAPTFANAARSLPQPQKQNILIVLFDALSAYHLSAYGYSRETAPNLTKLAERAIVYHNHFASGNYTVTGAGSLLTGVLPWKHRAFRFGDGVADEYISKNIFSALKSYHSVAYSHNPHVVRFLNQFSAGIANYIPYRQFLISGNGAIQSIFKNDDDIASVGWSRTMIKNDDEISYSLFLSELYRRLNEMKIKSYQAEFPRGIPNIKDEDYFLLEHAIDFLNDELPRLPQPFLGYFHFMPPHKPYTTSRDFYGAFQEDGFKYIEKKQDPFAPVHSARFMLRQRMEYDEYILYLDREFARLFAHLESSGLLENTWLVFTSDHGELFERGIQGHITPSLYQPVMRVPLMIFPPDNSTRVDVYDNTSAVDLLPTLLHLSGEEPAAWTDGAILPPFASLPERNIYAAQAANQEPDSPLEQSTTMLVRGNYKLVCYSGYAYELKTNDDLIQLYDIKNDPEELNDLSAIKKNMVKEMLAELKSKIKEANEPYL